MMALWFCCHLLLFNFCNTPQRTDSKFKQKNILNLQYGQGEKKVQRSVEYKSSPRSFKRTDDIGGAGSV